MATGPTGRFVHAVHAGSAVPGHDAAIRSLRPSAAEEAPAPARQPMTGRDRRTDTEPTGA
ncbi:hypothetical protein GCM10010358_72480 [Streptomyces minutiscleroticus]|uniref:Uncharacterized protein n=1 Tax=Streptomyces minutiscleroticus TaxID=68238 RepID=A0A918NZX1_9ACTN|nr:hypothetical protein GCM10010358_72480 [Streptomyces minutiscleroticus]